MWLFNSMDMLESQLRFGSSVSRKVANLVHVYVCLCIYYNYFCSLIKMSVSMYSVFPHLLSGMLSVLTNIQHCSLIMVYSGITS